MYKWYLLIIINTKILFDVISNKNITFVREEFVNSVMFYENKENSLILAKGKKWGGVHFYLVHFITYI